MALFIFCVIFLNFVSFGFGSSGTIVKSVNENNYRFPTNFSFGAATAAYQIEGGWNLDGKGPSIWDTLVHQHGDLIADHTSADIGPDSYHLFMEDIKALKETGCNHYRFSIAWSRILPDGQAGSINHAGIDYYNRVINALLNSNIRPVVTMYHYDLPQALQDLGGLTNPIVIPYFVDYARILFKNFGDRVKTWITFNEPLDFCLDGYGNADSAPLIAVPGVAEYLCAHHVILAHAKTYHLFKSIFRGDGKLGITLSSRFYFPKTSGDQEAVHRALQFDMGWFMHPIYSATGNYPQIMIDAINENSRKENRTWSRLPQFTTSEIELIRGSADFLGLNYYTSRYAQLSQKPIGRIPSYQYDSNLVVTVDPNWPRAKSKWLYSVPSGLRGLLKYFHDNYNNIEVLITENGYSDGGGLNDQERVVYLKEHLDAVLEAIYEDGCNVSGYTVWSIIDNFEWMAGFTERFGVYEVDVSSSNKTRTPKLSAQFLTTVYKTRRTDFYEL